MIPLDTVAALIAVLCLLRGLITAARPPHRISHHTRHNHPNRHSIQLRRP